MLDATLAISAFLLLLAYARDPFNKWAPEQLIGCILLSLAVIARVGG